LSFASLTRSLRELILHTPLRPLDINPLSLYITLYLIFLMGSVPGSRQRLRLLDRPPPTAVHGSLVIIRTCFIPSIPHLMTHSSSQSWTVPPPIHLTIFRSRATFLLVRSYECFPYCRREGVFTIPSGTRLRTSSPKRPPPMRLLYSFLYPPSSCFPNSSLAFQKFRTDLAG